ncbi:hypothetical protein RRG08_022644 [Elysia crispata]|uniref:Uncharacterized protein n=1 Tax=Elysia crispata TaxID=231223 RepID=A0AAE0Z1R7_9GAST|nr:hypothetical protein RRG08_022644 [Elysia crispata]
MTDRSLELTAVIYWLSCVEVKYSATQTSDEQFAHHHEADSTTSLDPALSRDRLLSLELYSKQSVFLPGGSWIQRAVAKLHTSAGYRPHRHYCVSDTVGRHGSRLQKESLAMATGRWRSMVQSDGGTTERMFWSKLPCCGRGYIHTSTPRDSNIRSLFIPDIRSNWTGREVCVSPTTAATKMRMMRIISQSASQTGPAVLFNHNCHNQTCLAQPGDLHKPISLQEFPVAGHSLPTLADGAVLNVSISGAARRKSGLVECEELPRSLNYLLGESFEKPSKATVKVAVWGPGLRPGLESTCCLGF